MSWCPPNRARGMLVLEVPSQSRAQPQTDMLNGKSSLVYDRHALPIGPRRTQYSTRHNVNEKRAAHATASSIDRPRSAAALYVPRAHSVRHAAQYAPIHAAHHASAYSYTLSRAPSGGTRAHTEGHALTYISEACCAGACRVLVGPAVWGHPLRLGRRLGRRLIRRRVLWLLLLLLLWDHPVCDVDVHVRALLPQIRAAAARLLGHLVGGHGVGS